MSMSHLSIQRSQRQLPLPSKNYRRNVFADATNRGRSKARFDDETEFSHSHLKPGGYIELQEFSIVVHCTPDTAEPKPHMVKWAEQMNEAVGKAGLDPVAPSKFDRQLQEAGFTNIVLKW